MSATTLFTIGSSFSVVALAVCIHRIWQLERSLKNFADAASMVARSAAEEISALRRQVRSLGGTPP